LDKNVEYDPNVYDFANTGADLNIDSFDTSIALDGALSGMAVGAGISVSAKYANQIKNLIKARKVDKQANTLNKIDNHVKEDELTR